MLDMNKARVLITDDSAFMRRAIRKMLEEEPDIEVVAVAHDGKMAIDYAKRHQPVKKRPQEGDE